MDKGIGFSRTIQLDWLDMVASLCLQEKDPGMIRQILADTIAPSVTGVVAQRKTIDVLTAIWVRSEKRTPQIRKEALDLFPTTTKPEERLWLHYGMTLVSYPLFRKCVMAIGQASRMEDTVTRKWMKDRMIAEFGHLGGLDRSIERIMASLTNWGLLSATKDRHIYQIDKRRYFAGDALQSWLLTCALYAHPSDGIPFFDLIHLPELYPFNLSIGVDGVQKDKRFEVYRQGGGYDLVKLHH